MDSQVLFQSKPKLYCHLVNQISTALDGKLDKNGKQDCSLPSLVPRAFPSKNGWSGKKSPGDEVVPFQLQRISQTLTTLKGGGGRGEGTSPMFLQREVNSYTRTQENGDGVQILPKYCKGCLPGLEAAQHANNLILSRDQRIPY